LEKIKDILKIAGLIFLFVVFYFIFLVYILSTPEDKNKFQHSRAT